MNNVDWVMPKYMREIIKSWTRRIVVETLERYGVIPDTDVDPTLGVQRLTALYNLLRNDYPNAFQYDVMDIEDGSKTLVIKSDTENKINQLKDWLINNKDLKWVTYFNAEDMVEGEYYWIMMLNSYEVTQ